MDAYRQFVRRFEEALGTVLPVPEAESAKVAASASGAPVALLFSPHPDDEVIMGTLPLRLQREAGVRVVNVAITLGSDPARRETRRRELEKACGRLGWDLEVMGWTGVGPEMAEREPATWQGWVGQIAQIVARLKPRWIFYPHTGDWHPTHRGVNKLVEMALEKAGPAGPPWRVQTEYWQPLAEPNLLVECPPDSLAVLVAALCCHAGEVARNPYHLTLPAWMADNVRRGAERVAGPGQPAPKFRFGALYRVEPGLPPEWAAVLAREYKLRA